MVVLPRTVAAGARRVTTDLLRKNVDSFYTLSCPTPDAPPRSLHSSLPRSSSDIPLLLLPLLTPLRRSSTHRHRPQRHRERGGKENSSFLSAPCATASSVRSGMNAELSKKWRCSVHPGQRSIFSPSLSLFLSPASYASIDRCSISTGGGGGKFRAKNSARGELDKLEIEF